MLHFSATALPVPRPLGGIRRGPPEGSRRHGSERPHQARTAHMKDPLVTFPTRMLSARRGPVGGSVVLSAKPPNTRTKQPDNSIGVFPHPPGSPKSPPQAPARASQYSVNLTKLLPPQVHVPAQPATSRLPNARALRNSLRLAVPFVHQLVTTPIAGSQTTREATQPWHADVINLFPQHDKFLFEQEQLPDSCQVPHASTSKILQGTPLLAARQPPVVPWISAYEQPGTYRAGTCRSQSREYLSRKAAELPAAQGAGPRAFGRRATSLRLTSHAKTSLTTHPGQLRLERQAQLRERELQLLITDQSQQQSQLLKNITQISRKGTGQGIQAPMAPSTRSLVEARLVQVVCQNSCLKPVEPTMNQGLCSRSMLMNRKDSIPLQQPSLVQPTGGPDWSQCLDTSVLHTQLQATQANKPNLTAEFESSGDSESCVRHSGGRKGAVTRDFRLSSLHGWSSAESYSDEDRDDWSSEPTTRRNSSHLYFAEVEAWGLEQGESESDNEEKFE